MQVRMLQLHNNEHNSLEVDKISHWELLFAHIASQKELNLYSSLIFKVN